MIISDNGSIKQDTLDYYTRQEQEGNFRVVKKEQAFNFARQCNLGAEDAKGDFLIFLNDDTEVITPHWIEEMDDVGPTTNSGIWTNYFILIILFSMLEYSYQAKVQFSTPAYYFQKSTIFIVTFSTLYMSARP